MPPGAERRCSGASRFRFELERRDYRGERNGQQMFKVEQKSDLIRT